MANRVRFDGKWHRPDATTVAECDMNQEAHCNSSGLRQQKRQIAPTAVRLLAYLLAANCGVAQTGKLPADKQAKIESAISSFLTTSKAPGISAAVVQDGEFVWSAGFGMESKVA